MCHFRFIFCLCVVYGAIEIRNGWTCLDAMIWVCDMERKGVYACVEHCPLVCTQVDSNTFSQSIEGCACSLRPNTYPLFSKALIPPSSTLTSTHLPCSNTHKHSSCPTPSWPPTPHLASHHLTPQPKSGGTSVAPFRGDVCSTNREAPGKPCSHTC